MSESSDPRDVARSGDPAPPDAQVLIAESQAQDPAVSRRALLAQGVALAGGMLAVSSTAAAAPVMAPSSAAAFGSLARGAGAASAYHMAATTLTDEELVTASLAPGVAGRDYLPVTVPDGATLPFRIVDGVKVFHLIAEEFSHEFAPGLTALCWGYNGRTPGPVIEAVEGDRVRIYVTNKLPAATSVHWHGVLVPSGMDGVAGLSQAPIQSGETFKYEFTLRQHGTFMYHSHKDEMVQIALGMMGMFVIHPRAPERAGLRRADRDFVLLTSEWKVPPGARRPDPLEMLEFNVFTFNGKSFPGTEALAVEQNDYVRVRLGNLSPMSHHPIHLHGHYWRVVATDGGPIHPAGQWPENTILVPTGTTRTMEFVANNPGDWAIHCHMTHHTMNQMGHNGGVNMLGVKPAALDAAVHSALPEYMSMGTTGMGDMAEMGMPVPRNSIPMVGADGQYGYIDMGGILTVLKVREKLTPATADAWYTSPRGALALAATAAELARDGIDVTQREPTR